MLLFKRVVVLAALSSSVGLAQTRAESKVSARRGLPATQYQYRLGASIWQESLRVRSGGNSASMQTQSQGLFVSVGRVSHLARRVWLQSYALDFSYGTIKGKGNTAAVPDELKGQPWMMFGLTPGVLYRSSPVSQVGLMLPLSYRLIEWKLKSGTEFNPDGDSSFSVGLSGVYINQLSRADALYLAVTHQTNWASTTWSIAWQHRFL